MGARAGPISYNRRGREAMLKKFLKETPQAASIVVGLACAGIVLEALRTPAVRNVTFEVFHPLPYLVEGRRCFSWRWR